MRLTNRCSGRVTIKCMRPAVILCCGTAVLRCKVCVPPLSSVVRRQDAWVLGCGWSRIRFHLLRVAQHAILRS